MPIENSSLEDIDKFYGDSKKSHKPTYKKYVISTDDFNAQIGITKFFLFNYQKSSVTGKYSYGIRSNRGERLVQYAWDLKNININLKPKNRWKWISPDRITTGLLMTYKNCKLEEWINRKNESLKGVKGNVKDDIQSKC